MAPIIRLATPEDAEPVHAIYIPFVLETPVSFEVDPPSVDEICGRIVNTLARLPWLVYENEGRVLGFVYASTHRARIAYQWSVDVSVYIDAQSRRGGIGRALYTSLFECLRLQGFYNAYAWITLPNPASVGLHEAMGFQSVGVYRSVGCKQGVWHDVGWWHLALQEHAPAPQPPKEFPEIIGEPEGTAALIKGLPLLRQCP